ncbi:putative anion-selective porin [Nitrospira tepida]|uniref:Anion-selective porin n=1 Tax=Nitrospira tepida TaxID=2973512 RepID=A0AA86MYT9_9BACT|nr:porin [Nitrospira tepida]CAI4031558.1 putative anion-selective porin [Nitrospira tepida]
MRSRFRCLTEPGFWVTVAFIVTAVAGGLSLPPAIAAESGRLVEKDGKLVFVESTDPAIKLLLERALKQGLITKEEYEKVEKESEERAYALTPTFKGWYDRGFNLSMNDNAFYLKIRFRAQLRYTQRFRNDAWRDPGDAKNFPELLGVFGDYRANRSDETGSSFNVRRARLYFMGHLFNPDFKYYVQLAGETAENSQSPGSVRVLDLNFSSTHFPLFNIQFGQYKVYFNRAQINSTASMQFAERALVMDAFTASGLDRRDIGITIMNDEEIYPVNYYVGIFNGAGPSFNRIGGFFSEQPTENCGGGTTGQNPFPSPASCPAPQRNINANLRNDINQLMYVARLNWNIMGRPGYGEGDLAYSETPQIAVGGGFSYNPAVNASSNSSFVGTDLANLNFRRQIAAFGNARQLGWGIVDYATWALDGVFKYRGFSLQGEYYFKNVTRHEKGLPCMNTTCTQTAPGLLGNATGWYVQTGYYVIPRYLEIAGRYAYWDPDTNSADDLIKQVDLSLNWFLNGTYDHQIMVTYSNIAMGTGGYAIGRSAPLPPQSGTIPLDASGGTLIENMIRVQYQIFF